MEHYLFLSSNDSLNYHTSNHSVDFTVELNRELLLEGRWKLALLDLTCDVIKSSHVTLCCDLCCPSWIYDQYLPVLRSFPVTTGVFSPNFAFPYYIESHASSVKRLRLYIISDTGFPSSFIDGPLRCTLHLQQQQQQ